MVVWKWPLPGHYMDVPQDCQGAFAAVRKFDVHTGVDLYCHVGQPVVAVESGKVVAIDEEFTGGASSPWWKDTKAVLVEGESGVVLYGEIKPEPNVFVGRLLRTGDLIGSVQQVLRKDKGLPTSMLHLELYEHGVRSAVVWELGRVRPDGLLDPTQLLIQSE